jgi:hypothetical protein
MDQRTMQTAMEVAKLPGVRPEVWDPATPEQRLATLNELEAINAKFGERPTAIVKAFAYTLPAGITDVYYGGYRIASNEILINPELLEHPEQRKQALQTTLHCGRYAFQEAALRHPERYPEIDERTRRAWAQPYVYPPFEGIQEHFDRVYIRPLGYEP